MTCNLLGSAAVSYAHFFWGGRGRVDPLLCRPLMQSSRPGDQLLCGHLVPTRKIRLPNAFEAKFTAPLAELSAQNFQGLVCCHDTMPAVRLVLCNPTCWRRSQLCAWTTKIPNIFFLLKLPILVQTGTLALHLGSCTVLGQMLPEKERSLPHGGSPRLQSHASSPSASARCDETQQ